MFSMSLKENAFFSQRLDDIIVGCDSIDAFPDLTKGFFRLRNQGCQMAYFQTKNPNLGKFCRALQWKILVYLWTLGLPILRPFGIFVAIWYSL
jgi:hypothetical protein